MTRTLARSVGTFRTRDVPRDPTWAGESRMSRDEEPDIEIHNHIPTDYGALTSEEMDRRPRNGEEPDDDEEFVELLPPGHFARETEDGRTAIYRRRHDDSRHPRSAEHQNLAFQDRRARDAHPPRTLAEMNKFLAAYYPRKRTTAAR